MQYKVLVLCIGKARCDYDNRMSPIASHKTCPVTESRTVSMTSLSTFARRAISHSRKTSLVVAASTRRTFAGTPEDSANLVKTALNELHKELGGDMVPFAGYELPVLYKGENGGVMKEHLWCRSDGKASLFDVSHMGQVRDV